MSRFGTRVRVGEPLIRWMSAGVIKSVQRGTITLNGAASATATILSVVPENSELVWLGVTSDVAGNTATQSQVRLDLTNATTVTATKASASGTVIVSFEVVEYAPGVIKAVRRGTIAVSGTSNTATIAAVDLQKCRLSYLGQSSTSNGGDLSVLAKVVLTNATTVTATRNTADGGVITVAYQVVEWF